MDDDLDEEALTLLLGDACAELYRQNVALLESFRRKTNATLVQLEEGIAEFAASLDPDQVGLPQNASWPPSTPKEPEATKEAGDSASLSATHEESLRSRCATLREQVKADERPQLPPAGLTLMGSLAPGGRLELSGLPEAFLARHPEVRWSRVLRDREPQPLPPTGRSYICSAEDVGAAIRVDVGQYSATSGSPVLPHRPQLQLLQEKVQLRQHDFRVSSGAARPRHLHRSGPASIARSSRLCMPRPHRRVPAHGSAAAAHYSLPESRPLPLPPGASR